MKKRKLGRALESVREDFRVGKHTRLSVLRVRFSPRSFSSLCRPRRRSVGLISSSYRTNSLFGREFFFQKSGDHVHARTCAICLSRAQCPLISARYTLAGDSLWSTKISQLARNIIQKSVESQLFPNWLEDRHDINTRQRILFVCTPIFTSAFAILQVTGLKIMQSFKNILLIVCIAFFMQYTIIHVITEFYSSDKELIVSKILLANNMTLMLLRA